MKVPVSVHLYSDMTADLVFDEMPHCQSNGFAAPATNETPDTMEVEQFSFTENLSTESRNISEAVVISSKLNSDLDDDRTEVTDIITVPLDSQPLITVVEHTKLEIEGHKALSIPASTFTNLEISSVASSLFDEMSHSCYSKDIADVPTNTHIAFDDEDEDSKDSKTFIDVKSGIEVQVLEYGARESEFDLAAGNSRTYVDHVFANCSHRVEPTFIKKEVTEAFVRRTKIRLLHKHVFIQLPFDPGEFFPPPIQFERSKIHLDKLLCLPIALFSDMFSLADTMEGGMLFDETPCSKTEVQTVPPSLPRPLPKPPFFASLLDSLDHLMTSVKPCTTPEQWLEYGSLQLDFGTFNRHAPFRETFHISNSTTYVKKLFVTLIWASYLMDFAIGDDKRLMKVLSNAVKLSKQGSFSRSSMSAKSECLRSPSGPGCFPMYHILSSAGIDYYTINNQMNFDYKFDIVEEANNKVVIEQGQQWIGDRGSAMTIISLEMRLFMFGALEWSANIPNEDDNTCYICFGLVHKILFMYCYWVAHAKSEDFSFHLPRFYGYLWAAIDSRKRRCIMIGPTTAFHDYSLDKNVSNLSEKDVRIFELGVSISFVFLLTFEDGILEVEAMAEDTHLGGKDFDNRWVSHFVLDVKQKHKNGCPNNPKAFNRLRTICAIAQRLLSHTAQTTMDNHSHNESIDFYYSVTHAKLEEFNKYFFKVSLKHGFKGALAHYNFLKIAGLQQEKMEFASMISWYSVMAKNMNREPNYVRLKTVLKSLGHLINEGFLHYHDILSRHSVVVEIIFSLLFVVLKIEEQDVARHTSAAFDKEEEWRKVFIKMLEEMSAAGASYNNDNLIQTPIVLATASSYSLVKLGTWYSISKGSELHYGQKVASSAYRLHWNELSFADILAMHNDVETILECKFPDSNLEDKVLIEDGRNVMNIIKIEDTFGMMSNYVWDPGKMSINRRVT